jgi:hypothetical protein
VAGVDGDVDLDGRDLRCDSSLDASASCRILMFCLDHGRAFTAHLLCEGRAACLAVGRAARVNIEGVQGIQFKESGTVEQVGEWRVSETIRRPTMERNNMDSFAKLFEVEGFAVLPDVIDEGRCEVLASHLRAFQNIGAGS